MVLMDIFDACDLDDNGTLSREEFSIYNVRTGDEQVTDDEWKIIQENFNQKNGEITIKGFLDLHQLEAEDSSDTEDMWLSLQAMGYNERLQLDEACPFLLELHSNRPVEHISVNEIQKFPQRPWRNFIQWLLEKADFLSSSTDILRMSCYKNDHWGALIVENKVSSTVSATLSLVGSSNIVVSPSDVLNRPTTFGGASTSILCFFIRDVDNESWDVQANLAAES